MIIYADSDVIVIFWCTYKHPREQTVKKKIIIKNIFLLLTKIGYQFSLV